MAVFQIVFGLTVFAITRQYYIQDLDNAGNDSTEINQPFVWPDGVKGTASTQLDASTFARSSIEDPVDLARKADEYFTTNQFDQAADSYQQLLMLSPHDVETYNNLGITLHYLGRSAEALRRLNEGVAIDPTHQRIWLTLGFVNRETGNTEQARNALKTAVNIDAGSEIGKAAAEMLENLP